MSAPDLREPSAQVARVAAERHAREMAVRRVHEALEKLPNRDLGCDVSKLVLDDALAAAKIASIDWGSDGSVDLVLKVTLPSRSMPTPEAHSPPLILLDPDWHRHLFEGDTCTPAPAVFDTLGESFAALPDGKNVVKVVERGAAIDREAVIAVAQRKP